VQIYIVILKVMTPCGLVDGYGHLAGTYHRKTLANPDRRIKNGILSVTVVKIYIVIFKVMTPCGLVEGYRHLGGTYCSKLSLIRIEKLKMRF
jgi:hypothetical protein